MALVNFSELNLSIDQDSKPLWSIMIDKYRYVLYSTNKALVFKDEDKEPSYEVTPIGCSCPADRYRSDACKHRKTISFLGDGGSGTPEMDPELNADLKETSKDSVEFDLDSLFG